MKLPQVVLEAGMGKGAGGPIKEKAASRASDALAAERRRLP
jgi:hypothetical protein